MYYHYASELIEFMPALILQAFSKQTLLAQFSMQVSHIGSQLISFYSIHLECYLIIYYSEHMPQSQNIETCKLIGFVGIIVQIVLGAMSFSVLIYKRYRESPKRAWKIWALDTSKQGTSQLFAHFINVAISMSLSYKLDSDACIWYLTTNILDNTLGVFVCVGILQLIEKAFFVGKYQRFQSGNYYTEKYEFGQQNTQGVSSLNSEINSSYSKSLQISGRKRIIKVSYLDWFIQFIIWNAIVIISKTILFFIQLWLNVPITAVSTFLIGWIQPYQTLELILVIIIVPLIMNGLAFWIQDNFLKKKPAAPGNQEFKLGQEEQSEQKRTEATAESKNQIRQSLL